MSSSRPTSPVLRCSWCKKIIPINPEINCLHLKLKEKHPFSIWEGFFFPFPLTKSGRFLAAVLPPAVEKNIENSYGLVFAACSKNCLEDSSTHLEKEIETCSRNIHEEQIGHCKHQTFRDYWNVSDPKQIERLTLGELDSVFSHFSGQVKQQGQSHSFINDYMQLTIEDLYSLLELPQFIISGLVSITGNKEVLDFLSKIERSTDLDYDRNECLLENGPYLLLNQLFLLCSLPIYTDSEYSSLLVVQLMLLHYFYIILVLLSNNVNIHSPKTTQALIEEIYLSSYNNKENIFYILFSEICNDNFINSIIDRPSLHELFGCDVHLESNTFYLKMKRFKGSEYEYTLILRRDEEMDIHFDLIEKAKPPALPVRIYKALPFPA